MFPLYLSSKDVVHVSPSRWRHLPQEGEPKLPRENTRDQEVIYSLIFLVTQGPLHRVI
jgi:hypothetical protein